MIDIKAEATQTPSLGEVLGMAFGLRAGGFVVRDVAGAATLSFVVDDVERAASDVGRQGARRLIEEAFSEAYTEGATFDPSIYRLCRLKEGSPLLPSGLEGVRMQFGPIDGDGVFLVGRILYPAKAAMAA